MPRLLFLCSRNRWRSPTAELIFADRPGVETDSAGLSPDAEVVVGVDQIEWAEKIFVMEASHRVRLNRKFGKLLKGKPVIVLGIPDNHKFMDAKLVHLLEERCSPHLR